MRTPFTPTQIRTFEDAYDEIRDNDACEARGEFIEKFPLSKLGQMKCDDYVIGLQKPTFCHYVESKTAGWAQIRAATAYKFGIYYGKTATDSVKKYRSVKRFKADSPEDSFKLVRRALIELVKLGDVAELDFKRIDANQLSQVVKAKILSLYFPDRFINVCSAAHLKKLAGVLKLAPDLPVSEYQHRLVTIKNEDPVTREWTNPKFMQFLYRHVLKVDTDQIDVIRKPRKKSTQKVDWDSILANRGEVGRLAEEYALEWERRRLLGAGLEDLIPSIVDVRDRPGYGFDFISHQNHGKKRHIEVKSISKLPGDQIYRFYLSRNEHEVSSGGEFKDTYYFYLVRFNKDKTPGGVTAMKADKIHVDSDMTPAAFTVRLDLSKGGF
tara:strand:+ start:511 stop:1656 length:1146 start_codon:yes stop_codon:yes gene_type:complete